uniref:Ig-like domain-containing protein n=1 Tax=Glossina brevipalpis TaxID=37001 RepID=A0A1A9WMP2_9MUSC
MPLRRLILALLATVICAMELSLCDAKLPQQLMTLLWQRNATISRENSNKFPNRANSLKVTPARTLTTATAETTPSLAINRFVSLSSHAHDLVPPPSLSSTSLSSMLIKNNKNLPDFYVVTPAVASLESAALIEEQSLTQNSITTILPQAITIQEQRKQEQQSTTTPSAAFSPITNPNSDYSEEWFYSLPPNALSTDVDSADDTSDLPPLDEEQQAIADLLTKGFSIPTFLPPFPVFAVADLPAYLNSVSTTTAATTTTADTTFEQSALMPNLFNSNTQEQHLFLDNSLTGNAHIFRNLTMTTTTNITVQMGNHAYMPCHIHRLQNKPVSWVRLRDGHIISVDQTTFIADQRFQAIYQNDNEFTWSLQIKYVQSSDEGWYECQVSVEPKMSAKVYLKIVVPLTELIGDQNRFVKAGSKVVLHCIVRGTLDPPQYIIWFRDKTQISDDNSMGWYTQLDRNIFGNSEDNQNTIGSLIIPFVRKMDSGNYTCQPSNSASVSVHLHVLSGDYSASAIMSTCSNCTLNPYYLLLSLLLMSSSKT